ncbi:MAG: ThuA domain-containing protein [Planctomycetaceae bacterium]
MTTRRMWLGMFILGLASSLAHAADAPAKSKVLFVTQSVGFKHGSVTRKERPLAPAEIALTQLGDDTGLFTVDCTQNSDVDFTKENLQNYDIVAFYTTGNLPIADADLDYFFNDWLKQSGHGVLGFHSALDTYLDYEPFYTMIGGTFIGHPWTAGTTVTLVNHDPDNPMAAPFGQEFVIKDEIYMYRHWNPKNVRVLLSLDYSRSPIEREVNVEHGYHVPVCWVREWGPGKIYVNNLGHNETSWTNEAYLKSITTAVKWIRGDIEASAVPNPEVSAQMEEKSRTDAADHDFKIKGAKN